MGDIHSLIGIIVVGIVIGWIASKLVHGKGMGILGDMVVGILGAFVGNILADKMHLHIADGVLGSLALSLLGAVVLLVVIRLLKPAN